LGGVLVGVAAGWVTAPRRGDWVRNQIRQKAGHFKRVFVRRAGKRGRDVRNRVRGGLAEVQHAWARPDPYVDANTLVDQVHSALGRELADLLPDVNLNAYGHTIYLHGHVPDAEARDRLVAAIRGVEGVGEVVSASLRLMAEPGPIGGNDSAAAEVGHSREAKPRTPRRRAT